MKEGVNRDPAAIRRTLSNMEPQIHQVRDLATALTFLAEALEGGAGKAVDCIASIILETGEDLERQRADLVSLVGAMR